MVAEDYAIVLDYMPQGKGIKREPLVQLIGTDYFTLLEAKPKSALQVLEKVYIGREERDKIEVIRRRINYNNLSTNSLDELEEAIKQSLEEKPEKLVEFFNNSRPISIRLHQIELLPGIGKKHLKDFIDEREKEQFKSLEDISKRVPLMPNLKKTVMKRIIQELEGNEKYYLFARRPSQDFREKNFRRRNYRH